ncbi:hypothetical protein KAFR_0D04910 [Kazachstania africana CBS 2517]|uniref:VWFA domain-containing protein n=1 Tax=Kazachstania africana (strain ATCC 22294 / BCRC 22015 / CBS 2517 / CECT 1963 / NBRC 1671 / NRRL Y-8276) TaxID=1071382 RepID=H2AUT8_KAZAF|nr:hypothetical protein KAFR_0D04910 [Kazachstania africana CBS 2517]CCF58138.1 hypothetical protein KAFR_0D04910 [Kazachstania africana CBS 2517]
MSIDQLESSISNLALDNDVDINPAGHSKKHRRSNRAFHSFTGNTPVGTPTMPVGVTFGGIPTTPGFNAAPPGFNANVASSPVTMNQEPIQQYPFPQPELTTTSHHISSKRWEDQIQYLSKAFDTSRDILPPLPTTQFYSVDQKSCDPRLMQLSMHKIPADEHVRSATKLPFGLTVQPFADIISAQESEIPVVSSNDVNNAIKPPLRCRRCRSYINPFYQLTYDLKAICNFCKVKMKLSEDETFGMDTLNYTASNKVELTKGCVDFLAPKAYNATPDVHPLPLHYIFVVDVSLLANENGSSYAVIDAIRNSVEYIMENQPNCKIAIMTYDNKLKFYNLRSNLESAQEYIVNELTDDVFIPFYNGLFVRPEESIHVINDTLGKISDFVRNQKYSHVPQSCYGVALQAARIALDTVTKGQGGKIICSLNSLPTIGYGNLSLKKDDNGKHDLNCNNEYYSKLSHNLLRSYISVDLLVTSAGFVDMCTVAQPVRMTSGNLKYYPHFRASEDDSMIINDMIDNISKITGYQALLKVRSSEGISVDQYYSISVDYSDRDPIIPVLTKDTTLDVLFKYDGKFKKTGVPVYFQTALLYTDINGIRKIRSMNCFGTVSNNINEIFQNLNENSIMRIMIKDVIRTLGDCDFKKIRESIDTKLIDVLTQYRALVSGNSSSQLVLPDCLKTLPMYMLSFEKTDLMKPNTQSTRGNERINDLIKLETLDSAQLQYKLYPQILPFHVLLNENDFTFYDANDKMLQLDQTSLENLSVRNGYHNLTNGGCYFIFQSEVVYLWFNENTNKMLLQDLLGVDANLSINQISLYSSYLPETGTDINEKASNVIKNWAQSVGKQSVPIKLLRPNIDAYYGYVMSQLLVEDKTINMIESFDNYLIYLHAQIQEKVKKEDYVKINGSSKSHETFHQKFVQF